MSTIQDDSTLDPLAARLKAEREARGWSITVLAERSGVSRAMISKVERGEASPTAALLGRLSGAFGLTVSALLARAEGPGAGLSRAEDQTTWRDPETGLARRALTPPGADPELVLASLPPGARIAYPAASYALLRGQCIWVISGALLFHEGEAVHSLKEGDCLALGAPADCAFENPSETETASYIVALSRR
ncbi:helix-turn-helix domain-containing protein [Elioraea rosea]|uniref:helix-turn-helix domain-containing protein n=1 Tax=Elioraea rosea TaxID=2492390 RepID=UPI00118375A4|nr:XRE family transcriptional regulator [Elioraea rosea]